MQLETVAGRAGAGVAVLALLAWVPAALSAGESRAAVLVTLVVVPIPAVVAATVVRHRPGNAVGWLLLTIGVSQPVGMLATQLLQLGAAGPWSLATLQWLGWLSAVAWLLTLPLFPLLLLLFPDGQPRSPRWRWLVYLALVVPAFLLVTGAFAPGPMQGVDSPAVLRNPIGLAALAPLAPAAFLALLVLPVLAVCGVASVVVTALRGTPVQRLQVRWVAFTAACAAAAVVVAGVVGGSDDSWMTQAALVAVVGGIPAGVGAAVLRYRLYDIDVVISRTIVYGAVTLLLGGVYAGVLYTAQGVGAATSSGSIVAVAAVAVLFAPVRDRLQRAVARKLFGMRDDPYAALSQVRSVAATSQDTALPALVEAISEALRVPGVTLKTEWGESCSAGTHPGQRITVPLSVDQQAVGVLEISPRAGGAFTAADQRLIDVLAEHAAMVVHTMKLTDALQRSRQQLVAVVEEERRRLRHDLHDSLGPSLAAIALGLDNLTHRAEDAGDGETAAISRRLMDEATTAVQEIRQVVRNLRPSTLDELGLVAALRAHLESFSPHLDVDVGVDGALPSLPAAVEVAAYRIALEAVTNASRHSEGRRCSVRLWHDGVLHVEVTDDGSGITNGMRLGVGLTSMRERAAEVGGTLTVQRSNPGTRVTAVLPVVAP